MNGQRTFAPRFARRALVVALLGALGLGANAVPAATAAPSPRAPPTVSASARRANRGAKEHCPFMCFLP